MNTMIAGIVVLVAISIGGYTISRKMDGKGENPKFFYRIQQILRVLVDLSTVISMILVFFTLVEMQKERDHAYMPNIVAENSSLDVKLNAHVGKNTIDINSVTLNLYNVGVGVAEQVSISVDESSYLKISKYLDSIADDDTNSYSINETNFVTKYPDGTAMMTPRKKYNYTTSFVLQNAQEKINYKLPQDLISIITDIEVCRLLSLEKTSERICEDETFYVKDITIPDVELRVKFQDVQGKKYDNIITLHFEQGVISSDKDGITYEKLTIMAY